MSSFSSAAYIHAIGRTAKLAIEFEGEVNIFPESYTLYQAAEERIKLDCDCLLIYQGGISHLPKLTLAQWDLGHLIVSFDID